MDVSELYRGTVEEWERRVAAVDGGWTRRTPCELWDVRALVNHVVGEDLWTAPLVEGATMEDVGDRFDGDVLGEEPVAAATAAAAAALAAVETHLPDQRLVHLSFGDTPIEEYLMQLAADHLVHGWDLAAATGQDRTLPPEMVSAVADWYAGREHMYRDAGAVAARPPAADDPQSQLLAGFGRDPVWAR